MTHRNFFTQLGLVAGGIAILLFGFNYIPALEAHQILSWSTWFLYLILSIIIYLAAFRAAKSSNPHNFHLIVIGFIAGKMFLSLIMLVTYLKLMQPDSRGFLIPFFITYFSFSIFEYYVMIRLGKTENETPFKNK